VSRAASDARLPAPVDGVQQVLVSHQVGGAGLIAIALAKVVKARGALSRAWLPGPGPAAHALDAIGVPWSAYSLGGLQSGGAAQIATWLCMAPRLARHRRSVVHVHSPTVYGLLSPVLKLVGATTIAQFHLEPTRDDVLWALQRPPSMVITCARYIAAQVKAVTDEAGQHLEVVAIPNAIDVERFPLVERREAKRRVGAAEGRWLMLMLANLSEHKGQLTAIRALKQLRDRGVDVECWLAGEERGGETTFTRRLLECAADLGVAAHVKLLGFRSDGPALLQAADFFLLPSTLEGLPLSVLEAQAAGAVVLGSPIPGIREVVEDGVTGVLVPPDNAAAYADRMLQLIGDSESYARIAVQARARVIDEHNWERYVSRTWQVYSEVTARQRG
jgi:glycosyltransferase involved in cell wall biosynthesis